MPDTPDRILSGKLTAMDSDQIRFIGHLSDQQYSRMPGQYTIAAIISGPEPQRTRFETELLPQLKALPGPSALARGVIAPDPVSVEGQLTIFPYLDREGVSRILNTTNIVVCRTGYSSIMDLLQVGTKAILVPTPGQPEQEYLGERLQDHPQFLVQQQGQVNIREGFPALSERPAVIPQHNQGMLLGQAITELQERIASGSTVA